MTTKAKNVLVLSLSFLLPGLILLAAFAAMGMAPFGGKSTLIMDMSNQYVEFLCGLKNGDVYFSWSKSLGSCYIGVFAYYVSSPLSALTLFVPNELMPIAVLYLTAFKVGLCGLSFALLLQYRFGPARHWNAVFAMFYALMGYSIAYSMCIMWLDAVFWLPAIILGLEKILEGKGTGLFTASLFLSFISNYYLSYMSGLFTALYFLYRCLEERLPRKRVLLCLWKFVQSVFCAAALGAFLLLPTLASLFQGKLSGKGMDYSGTINFTLPRFLIKLLPGSYDSITNSGAPFLYCGALTLLLFLSFFFLRRISLRSRLLTGAFALLLFSSLWLSALDKVWHVFQYPNWFPYRYTYVFSFLMILTAYRALLSLELNASPLLAGIALLCAVDMFCNSYGILRGLDDQFGFESFSDYRGYKQSVSALLSHAEDGGFFRVGATLERSKNEAIGFGYNGITHYSSAYNEKVNRFLSRLGFAQSYFWCSYFGSTAVTDALFSVRYVISDYEMPPNYSALASNSLASIYNNPDALSVGLAANRETLEGFAFEGDPFESQNCLVQALTGAMRDCFVELEAKRSKGARSETFSFVSNGAPVYAYFSGSGGGALYVNGEYVSRLFTDETRCIRYIGRFDAGEKVHIRVESPGLKSGSLRYLDTEAWEAALDILRPSGLAVDSYDNRRLTGTVTAREGDALFTTIPYDRGWTAFVDGKKAEISIFADTLMLIPLSAGTHRIELVYTAPGLVPGISISLAAAALLAFNTLRVKRREKTV